MNVRIIKKPDFLRSLETVYSVQKKYWFWPFWVEHGFYKDITYACLVADELRNPIVKEKRNAD